MGLIIEIIFIIVILIYILTYSSIYFLTKKLKDITNKTNLSGFEIARQISSKLTTEEPHIIKKQANYYDENRNTIKLSSDVFDGTDMYSSIIATNVALHTDSKRTYISKYNRLNSFLVLISYIVIILGAFLTNTNIIYFGLLLFILAFIFGLYLCTCLYGKGSENIEQTQKFIKDEKVIKPFDDVKEELYLLSVVELLSLPYSFINYFR